MRKASVVDVFRFLIFMRLDLYLVISRLVKRRTLAQEFCDKGLVKINELVAKSSKEVKAGDIIEIRRRSELLKIRVLKLPDVRQIAKADISFLFEVISVEKLKED